MNSIFTNFQGPSQELCNLDYLFISSVDLCNCPKTTKNTNIRRVAQQDATILHLEKKNKKTNFTKILPRKVLNTSRYLVYAL